MSFKHQIAIALGVVTGSVCLISWLKPDPESNQSLSKLRPAVLESEESADAEIPKPLGSSMMDGAKELEPMKLTDEFALSEIPADLPVELNSTLLTSGLQTQAGNVASLLDLNENEFIPAPREEAPETLELAPELTMDSGPPPTALADSDLVPEPITSATELLTETKREEESHLIAMNDLPQQKLAPAQNLATAQNLTMEQSATQFEKPVDNSTPVSQSPRQAVSQRAHALPNWKTNPYFDPAATSEQPQVSPAFNQPNQALPVQSPGVSQASPAQPLTATADFTTKLPVSVVEPANFASPVPSAQQNQEPVYTPFQMGLSEPVAQQAVHHIEYGKSLARRGASLAARQEFFSALRVVAQANDATTGGSDFSTALADAVRAMKEAEDFLVKDSQVGGVIDVAETIEAHKTQILTERAAKRMTPLAAMQEYYSFAQRQLDFAGGRSVVTAEALHCLGKLHTVMASHKKIMPGNLDVAKAIVFHKTSLLSNVNNPASANELGVLMAKTGQLEMATELFKNSLIAQSSPQAWNNLAKTHHRLGESKMAQLAETELVRSAQSSSTTIAAQGIKWVQKDQFNAMAAMEFEPRVAAVQPQLAAQPAVKASPNGDDQTAKDDAKSNAESLGARLKKWF